MTIDRKCLINWVGGKRLLRKTIAKLIPEDIKSYIEPFGGGGWVLFYKDKWADLEVYNDLDGRLVNLFRIVKYHPNAFIEEWRHLLGSREMFLQFLNGTFITDIQKAVQFYFLITRSFGGRGDTFGTVKKTSGGACKSLHNVPKKIEAIHERLDTVMIEGRDFEKLINQYDHEGAFFYCDPPYFDTESMYKGGFTMGDHMRLFNTFREAKGKVLISYNDCAVARKTYDEYCIMSFSRVLLIANYPIKELYERQAD